MSLRHLQNHTTLKHCYLFWSNDRRLRHLQNHTTLKHHGGSKAYAVCLRHLQNHTTLKPQIQVQGSKACPVTTKCNPVNTVKSNRSHYLKYTH